MKIALMMAMVMITGCTAMTKGIASLPSVQNCSEVTYHRIGNQVDLTAKCQMPIEDVLP